VLVTEPITIVVADDQPVIRDGFAAVLDAQPDMAVIGRASNGRELLDLFDDGMRPDIALVDIRMPVMDGLTATAHISAHTTVLILTTFDLDDYVHEALRAGASGFLLKDVPAARLIEAVRLVSGGSLLLGPSITRKLMSEVAAQHARPLLTASDLGLTPRETEILTLLVTGATNAEIAQELTVSVETVKSHVGEVLRKLNVRDRVQAIIFTHEHGLINGP
jgi:DNA-binding NarL/FixJ family response regulator